MMNEVFFKGSASTTRSTNLAGYIGALAITGFVSWGVIWFKASEHDKMRNILPYLIGAGIFFTLIAFYFYFSGKGSMSLYTNFKKEVGVQLKVGTTEITVEPIGDVRFYFEVYPGPKLSKDVRLHAVFCDKAGMPKLAILFRQVTYAFTPRAGFVAPGVGALGDAPVFVGPVNEIFDHLDVKEA